jgi:hypothetical protein
MVPGYNMVPGITTWHLAHNVRLHLPCDAPSLNGLDMSMVIFR